MNDLLVFNEDEDTGNAKLAAVPAPQAWHVLLVDDEPDVHQVTRLALEGMLFEGLPVQFASAYSAAEAREVMQANPYYALVLLDVVMEEDDAGLQLVSFIRNTLQNRAMRIVLRTGQPGKAPERKVVDEYDIDDYKQKADLTVQQLYTTVVSSLRAYREIARMQEIADRRLNQIDKHQHEQHEAIENLRYAHRIQLAMLPSHEIIQASIPQFFAHYMPKHILSGDLYWFAIRGDEMLLAVIDCVGHGLRGASLSMLAFNYLNQIIAKVYAVQPALVLGELADHFIDALQDLTASQIRMEGMDIALCKIDLFTLECKFAGARRPLWIYHPDGRHTQLVGDAMTIGEVNGAIFTEKTIQLAKGDTLYMFTDGVADQLGGPNMRRFARQRLQNLLLTLQQFPFAEHHDRVRATLRTWQGNMRQTDDVLMLGLRI